MELSAQTKQEELKQELDLINNSYSEKCARLGDYISTRRFLLKQIQDLKIDIDGLNGRAVDLREALKKAHA